MSEEEATATPEVETPESGELEQAATEVEESTTAEPEESATSEDGDDSAAPRKGVGKRIDELTAARRRAEREADFYRQELERERASKQQPAPKPEEPAKPPPTLESAGYDEAKYQQEMAEWVKANIEQQFTARERQALEKQREQAKQKTVESYFDRAAKFAAENPEYDSLVLQNDKLPITPEMAEAIVSSEKGPEVALFLAKNPAEASRISQLSPYAAALEIGRIDAKLALTPPKKTTKAPPPINTLSGSGNVVTDPEKMSTSEWKQWREAQLRKR